MSEPTASQPTPTPENNLALRYNYVQLDAAHRAMADRVAALIVAYPDITRLNDPAKQRQLIQEVMNSGAGRTAGEQAGNVAGTATSLASQIPGLREIVGTARTAGAVAETTGNAAHAGAVGAGTVALPFTMSAEAAGEFYNQLKVIGNNLTPEQAQSLGAAYASVFQARAAEREARGLGAAVSSVDNFLAYGAASFAFAWDFVRQIPLIGPLLQKLDPSPTRSFAEHLRRATNDADVKATRQHLVAAQEIDGVDTRHWAEALTQGGALQNRSGQDTPVNAPTKDDPVPTAPEAPKDAQGNPVVAPADPVAVGQDALDKAGSKAGTSLVEHFRGIDTPQEWAIVAAGVLGGGYVAARVAPTAARAAVSVGHGIVRSGVSVTRSAVLGVTGLGAGLVQGTADLIPGGKSGQFRWAEDGLREAEMARDARQARVEVRQARVDELQAKPAAERTFADRATLKVDEARLGGAQNSLRVAEESVATSSAKVAARAEIGASVLEQGGHRAARVQAASSLTETAGRIERFGDAASAAISRFAGSRLGVETTEIAVRATKFGKLARFVGRAIPGIGLAGTAAAVFLSPSDAHAAEYGRANYWQRLDRDHEQGKITDAEYASYRSLQTVYVGTGVGGIITAGVTEAVQNGAEHMDKERMSRYLPASLVKEVSGMVDEHRHHNRPSGALGSPDTGLAVAATSAPAAHEAARPVARQLVNSRVAAVGNAPQQEERHGFEFPKLPTFKMEMPDLLARFRA